MNRMTNLNGTMIDRRLRSLMLGGAALTAALLLINLRDSVALIVAHFPISWSAAILIISLILDGSWLLYLWFPYVAPAGVTIQVLIALFGVSVAAGW
jgi:hypothetical protein